jgi:hypothetical protein
MTSRATLGDFLTLATEVLQGPGAAGIPGGEDVQQTCESLSRVVAVMRQYLQEPPRNPALLPAGKRPLSPGWSGAQAEALQALGNAAAWLGQPPGPRPRRPGARHRSWLTPRLDHTATALRTGRDLLSTHFARSPEGVWQPRSEWADVLASPQAREVLLAEMADLARQVAPLGARVALTPGWRGSPESRRKLNTACQWLWVLSATVRAADEAEPVPAEHCQMLRAVTSSQLPSHKQPTGSESIPQLCAGIAAAAERARRVAWRSGHEAAWSPAMTITSLRITAGSGVVISHNNQKLLHVLADASSGPDCGQLHQQLRAAADGAGRARDAWLKAAQTLAGFTTDVRGHVGRVAAETSNLALWTGRLTYTDPGWNLSSSTTSPPRPVRELAGTPAQQRHTVAAVHEAASALDLLAAASQRQVQTAARAGRILVPVSSIPDSFDIPCPFTRAPAERISALLEVYLDAEWASADAKATIAEVAEAVEAPSRVLAAAARIAEHRPHRSGPDRTWAQHLAAIHHPEAGPTERLLRDLNVSDSEVLTRAAEIDRASERLVLFVCEEPARQRSQRLVADLTTSTGTAALVNQRLAIGGPHTAAMLSPNQSPPGRTELELM